MSDFNDSSSKHSHSQHRNSTRRPNTQPYEHVHSTPIQHKTTSLRTSNSEPIPRHARSPPIGRVRQNLNSTLCGCEAGSNSSMDSSMISITNSPSRQARVADFENATIQKQRQELHLLVAELRDRDRELNDMVSSHHKQLLSWDQDRQKILLQEHLCSQLEQTLHERNDELRALTAKLNIAESSTQNQMTALDSTQRQLARVTEQHSQAEAYVKELEEKNRSVNQALVSQASSVGQLEAREHELRTVLKLKDRDLVEAANQITELCRKLKKFGAQYRESRLKETETKRKLIECKNKCSDTQYQLSVLQREQLTREQELDDNKIENQRLCQEIATLKQELLLFDEREKRKDQLVVLQKSKQERLESELSTLQQLYERQQQDLCLLHLKLESTKSLLDQQGALLHNKQSERSVEQNGELERSLNTEPVRELGRKTDSGLSKETGRDEGLGEGKVNGKKEWEEEGETGEKGSNGVDERCNPGLMETVLPPYMKNSSLVNTQKTNTSPPTTNSTSLQAEPYHSPDVTTVPGPCATEKTSDSREDHEGSRIPILLPRANKSDPLAFGKQQPRRNSPRHKSDSAVPSGGKMENSPRQRRGVSRGDYSEPCTSASQGENGGKDWDDRVMKEEPKSPPVVPDLLGQGDIQQPINASKTSTRSTSEMSTMALSILYNSQSSAGGDTSHGDTSHANGAPAEKQTSKDGVSVLDFDDDDIMNEKFPEMDFCSTPKKNNSSLEDADTSDVAEDVKSPVSKLHKLLTESCELVRDLERSVLSSSSAADEEETETLVDIDTTS